jgi:hypothetical protein
MIISALMTLIAASCLVQPNAPRLFAALVFGGMTVAHDLAFAGCSGIEYYGSAALADLAIMIFISGISPTPRMVINLQWVCIASIVTNIMGWVMWLTYLSPVAYNYAYVLLYIIAFVVLTKKDNSDVGGFTLDGWMSCFRVNIFTGALNSHGSNDKA